MLARIVIACAILSLGLAVAPRAAAQEVVATCLHVEGPPATRESLERLVASEVDRHRSHRVVETGCATHLKVELIEVGAERFLTGRVGGEVPDRVRVEGPDAGALERALTQLLRVVLGNDPVALHVPGGTSWLGRKVLELRHDARGTFDAALLETVSFVPGVDASTTFMPGLLFGYAREIASFQVGIEALGSQRLQSHPGRLGLNTELRLQAVATYYFSADADVSGFAAAGIGLGHQRFSGPRPADYGAGDGAYAVTGPAASLRVGVELFRTTTMRASLLGEAFLPIFWANDREEGIVSGWVPSVTLGAGARF